MPMSTSHHAIAACLTPPLPGGVAVIEVVGAAAPNLINPLLRARRPIDLTGLPVNELRLARLMDGEETIDDVIVSVRPGEDGRYVVDLTLHGGPRVVQRALLSLKGIGIQIVEQTDMLSSCWPRRGPRQESWLASLLRAKTPAVAEWLMRMRISFPAEIRRIVMHLETDRTDEARLALHELCQRGRRLPYLLEGVRVVLMGGPNVGKSTLANALAEREGSIVSPTAGTTRDWVEHPISILGVPFVLVDTAGLQESDDPVECEAVRRACAQMATADLLIRVMDISMPPSSEVLPAEQVVAGRKAVDCPIIYVWNKEDLPSHSAQAVRVKQAGSAGLRVSARTGAGLDALRQKMVHLLGLTTWESDGPGPFDEEGLAICAAALSELSTGPSGVQRAVRRLNFMINPDTEVERSSVGGI